MWCQQSIRCYWKNWLWFEERIKETMARRSREIDEFDLESSTMELDAWLTSECPAPCSTLPSPHHHSCPSVPTRRLHWMGWWHCPGRAHQSIPWSSVTCDKTQVNIPGIHTSQILPLYLALSSEKCSMRLPLVMHSTECRQLVSAICLTFGTSSTK